jgi:hypothetical protein
MAPTRRRGGGRLLLLQRIRLQGVVVVDVHHLLLHVLPVVILDHGVVVALLLLDLMLNLKIQFLSRYRYKKTSRILKFKDSGTGSKLVISLHKIITERYL